LLALAVCHSTHFSWGYLKLKAFFAIQDRNKESSDQETGELTKSGIEEGIPTDRQGE